MRRRSFETLLNRIASPTDNAIVPALWLYEVFNVTGLAVRKGRITEEKAKQFLDSLADLPIKNRRPDPNPNERIDGHKGRYVWLSRRLFGSRVRVRRLLSVL